MESARKIGAVIPPGCTADGIDKFDGVSEKAQSLGNRYGETMETSAEHRMLHCSENTDTHPISIRCVWMV